ncbi:MAG: hypothetical protein ACOH18_00275 [Candidatus Saccharimonadaceae bacterium]
MSSQWILFISLVVAIILAIDIMRRGIASIITTKNEQKMLKEIRQLRRSKQPWVTVLVYGNNQSMELERTVRKIRQGRYSNYDIVAVSDYSGSDTAMRMKRYIDKTNHKVEVQFLQRRVIGTKMDAYRAAYRKSRRGKIIVCLSAGDEPSKLLLKRAVILQRSQHQWQLPVQGVNEVYGLIAVVKALRSLFWRDVLTAQVYTPRNIRRSLAPSHHLSPFLASMLVQVVLVSVITLGVLYAGPIALWYAWVLFSLYLLALVWVESEASVSEKWKFSFSVPAALFLMPVVGVVEGATKLRIRK